MSALQRSNTSTIDPMPYGMVSQDSNIKDVNVRVFCMEASSWPWLPCELGNVDSW